MHVLKVASAKPLVGIGDLERRHPTMRNIMLAILAVAFATLARSAMAAEGQGDDNANKQPTMAELASKVDSLGTRLGAIEATLGNLATATVGTSATSLASKVDAHSSTATANHTTIVGKFAQQMAVVMTVPTATSGHNAVYYLVGDSSIASFPKGTVATSGQFTDRALPTGTYLFEVQQPYSDNVLCNGKVSMSLTGSIPARHFSVCPRVVVTIDDGIGGSDRFSDRLYDGFGIYDITEKSSGNFYVTHKFPSGFAFTDAKPLSSYAGAVRITKLK